MDPFAVQFEWMTHQCRLKWPNRDRNQNKIIKIVCIHSLADCLTIDDQLRQSNHNTHTRTNTWWVSILSYTLVSMNKLLGEQQIGPSVCIYFGKLNCPNANLNLKEDACLSTMVIYFDGTTTIICTHTQIIECCVWQPSSLYSSNYRYGWKSCWLCVDGWWCWLLWWSVWWHIATRVEPMFIQVNLNVACHT